MDRKTTHPQTTELERRVLAHEKVLQALIAYMSRAEPHFVDHLKERFVEPMKMVRHEHDYRETDDFAEEFIRAVMRLGEDKVSQSKKTDLPNKDSGPLRPRKKQASADATSGRHNRIQTRERNGIWEITVDRKFYGDYHQKEHADTAAAHLRCFLR